MRIPGQRPRTITTCARFSSNARTRGSGGALTIPSRNGNLYPTHGRGPVALYLDIDRGDRFEYLVSVSTPEMGLTDWRADHADAEPGRMDERYVTGDLSVSLIKTTRRRTIRLEHDVSSPQPYSRFNSVQGTAGIFEDYPPRVYLEGMTPSHRWQPIDEHQREL